MTSATKAYNAERGCAVPKYYGANTLDARFCDAPGRFHCR